MPQFSILVSELTPQLLAKAEYWKIVGVSDLGGKWADTRPPYALIATGEPDYPLYLSEGSRHYHKNLRCFPVSLSNDGTEVRLECPRLPDESLIAELRDAQVIHRPTLDVLGAWVFCAAMIDDIRDIAIFAPTSEHSPRLSLEGVWVWSTRR